MCSESNPEHYVSIEVPSQKDILPKVLEWYENICFIPQGSVYQECQTALMEGFTNAVRHAHSHLPDCTPILIKIQIHESVLQLMIWDQGKFYDFSDAMHQLSNAGEQVINPLNRERHWGQVLFLQMSRERGWQFSYDRLPDQRNRFLGQKRLTE